MTDKQYITDQYFDWLYNIVCGDMYPYAVSYTKLITLLNCIQFRPRIRNDRNRASYGVGLRDMFANERNLDSVMVSEIIDNPCTVLELMIALAIQMEQIMDDDDYGDRTRQWFWGMVKSLGLSGMYDCNFDRKEVHDVVIRFINREYEPNGRGGLFTVNGRNADLRSVEIWVQMQWYIEEFI